MKFILINNKMKQWWLSLQTDERNNIFKINIDYLAGVLLFTLRYKTHVDFFVYARERESRFTNLKSLFPPTPVGLRHFCFMCLFEPWHFMWKSRRTENNYNPIVFKDQICAIFLCPPIEEVTPQPWDHEDNKSSV